MHVVLLLLVCLTVCWPHAEAGEVQLFQSSGSTGERLAQKGSVKFGVDFPFTGPTIHLSNIKEQEIHGFGGAFTEAAALVFQSLPVDKQLQVLELYWGVNGIGYTTGRVHINSCDFSPLSYSFDDVDGDLELQHFDGNVTHDTVAMIPFIRAAQDLLRDTGKELKLLAAPWSPPAWMKTNGKMDGSDRPGLKDTCRASWAKYFSKWISAYKAHGIPIWAVAPQNEPENVASWEACVYTPEQEMEFVAEFLGPTLQADHPDVKILVFDHNKEDVYTWAQALYSNPKAAQYADGVAFHWYTGDHFDGVARIRKDFPQAMLLATEATFERYRWRPGSTLITGDWAFGEGYAHDIIGDLNAGATGWIDWNLLLNQDGGPNHVGNVCDAAMLVKSGQLYVHPQYYAIGHFSKYILPGSRRLSANVTNTRRYDGWTRPYGTCTADDGLEATTFLRPDGLAVVVVLNCADKPVAFKIKDGPAALNTTIPAHGIQTYLYPYPGSADLMV